MVFPDTRSQRPAISLRRFLRVALFTAFALVLLPYLLTPLYLVVRPVSTPMLARWLTLRPVTRIYVPIEAISPAVPQAVIAAEDARFCAHSGIDWQSLREAIEDAEDVDDLRGGSTITQQVAKNLFLWQGRSFVRKALEFPLAVWIDLILPKRRILEIYLNTAEWGPDGEFGVEAGARHAFNGSAQRVGPAQAALLAAILPNLVRRSARQPGPAVRRIAGIIAARAGSSAGLSSCIGARRAP